MAPNTPKETQQAATAVAEAEQPQAPPRTAEQTAATEKALGFPAPAAGAVAAARQPARIGIAPTTLEEGWRLAQMMARSELVPKNFRNKPEDILVAIQMGVEIGFAPMQSLQSIAVINGRPSVWGDGFLALIMCSALYRDHDEYYEVDGERRDGLTLEDMQKLATVAVCTFWRHGKTTPVTRRFTIAQAKKAELWGKAGPWVTYPDRMLAMRARSWAGRDCFPDLLRGMKTAEEVADSPAEDLDLPPVVREVRRMSESKPADAPTTTPIVIHGTDVLVGPLGVKDVEQFLGGFTVTLGDGTKVDTIEASDALELEKFKGTKNQVRLTCLRATDGNLQLKSFAIAD